MKGFGIILLTFLGSVVISEVQSGIILAGLQKVHERTRCGLHSLGNRLHNHSHGEDPCIERVHPNQLEQNNKDGQDNGKGVNYEEAYTRKSTSTLEDTSGTSTSTTTVPVREKGTANGTLDIEEGRRLITAGANCPDGYRADAKGNCYLLY